MSALLAFSALLLLVFWQGYAEGQVQGLAVSIAITYTPPPNTDLGPNEYRVASGPFTFTCEVNGASGSVTYMWTSDCFACIFATASTPSVSRTAFRSTDSGNHTCTAVDAGISGSATTEVKIVGVGIFVFDGEEISPIETGVPNNSLVISRPNDHDSPYLMSFRCRSDSREANIGEIIGLNGNLFTGNEFLLVEISADIMRPADVYVRNLRGSEFALTSSQQGVYTCRIPDQSGMIVDISIGIYPNGFNSPPIINTDLEFFFTSTFSTLTCTSTSSPATNVVWMKDGLELSIDGAIYEFIQIVSNRVTSTFETVLTINSQLSTILSHIYTCRVSNTLGEDSRTIEAPSLMVVTEQTNTSVAGDLYILTCIFNYAEELIIAGQPSIEWITPNTIAGDSDISLGVVVAVGSNTYARTLQFNPLQTSHGGQYTCQVSVTVSGEPMTVSAQETVIIQVPNPTVTVSLGPFENVTLHHGNTLTITCRIQLDLAIDSPVIVTGELSGPGGATSDIVTVSTGIYQTSLTIASLQESPMDIYTCNNTIISMPSLMFVTDSAEVSASIAISILSTVPGPVQNIEATSNSSNAVSLSWEEPVMTGGRIVLYLITVSNGAAVVDRANVTERKYAITDLEGFVPYMISITAATSAGFGDLQTTFVFSEEGVPSAAPSNVNGDRIDGTRMRVSWAPLTLELARGFITHYTVFYQSTLMEVVMVPGNETTVVIGGLAVAQSYSISVSAGTSVGNGESSPVQTVATTSNSLFQLLLIGVTDCSQLLSSASEAVEIISTTVQQGLEELCQCGLTSEHITEAGLQCLGDADQVTYRARIYSTGSVSSPQLNTLIAQWIDTTMTIVILGIRVDIQSNCPINIESFSDPECQPNSDNNTGIIIGAVIGSTVLILIVATIMVVISVTLRKHHDKSQTRYEVQSDTVRSGEPTTAECVAYGISLQRQAHSHNEIPLIENPAYGSGKPPLPPRRVTNSTTSATDDDGMYEDVN